MRTEGFQRESQKPCAPRLRGREHRSRLLHERAEVHARWTCGLTATAHHAPVHEGGELVIQLELAAFN